MCQGRMRAELEPNVDTEICNRVDCGRELHRLPDAAAPVSCTTRFTGNATAGDGTEQRNGLRIRRQISKRLLERLGSRLHHLVMKWMVDAHESREDALK